MEYEEAPAALAAMQALHTKYHWTGGDTTMVVEWMDPARHRKDKQAQEDGEAVLAAAASATVLVPLLLLPLLLLLILPAQLQRLPELRALLQQQVWRELGMHDAMLWLDMWTTAAATDNNPCADVFIAIPPLDDTRCQGLAQQCWHSKGLQAGAQEEQRQEHLPASWQLQQHVHVNAQHGVGRPPDAHGCGPGRHVGQHALWCATAVLSTMGDGHGGWRPGTPPGSSIGWHDCRPGGPFHICWATWQQHGTAAHTWPRPGRC